MSFFKQFQQAWDALDYADVGEFLPYAEKCRVLGIEPPPNYDGYLPPLDDATRRTVALNLGRDLTTHTINYAINMAQRMKAGLTLLYPYPRNLSASTKIIQELHIRISEAGINWQETELVPPWNESVFTFLRHHAEVICLIITPTDIDPNVLMAHSQKKRGWTIPAPVVVVHGETPLPQAI